MAFLETVAAAVVLNKRRMVSLSYHIIVITDGIIITNNNNNNNSNRYDIRRVHLSEFDVEYCSRGILLVEAIRRDICQEIRTATAHKS
jgi:hypothetical protein